MTTCPHCKNWSWSLNEITVAGAGFRYYAVQCTTCDAPAGIVEFTNIGADIEELEKKVDAIASTVANIDQNVVRLGGMVKRAGH